MKSPLRAYILLPQILIAQADMSDFGTTNLRFTNPEGALYSHRLRTDILLAAR